MVSASASATPSSPAGVHELHGAGLVAEHDELHLLLVPHGVDPACDGDRTVGGCGELLDEGAVGHGEQAYPARKRRIAVVPADLIHLVRHGEVYNPDRVLYGRIPGFGLSELGQQMAKAASDSLDGHPVTRLVSSPLQRTIESAQPWADRFGLDVHLDERVIEPTNRFEGGRFKFPQTLLKPEVWPWIRNPTIPSWGSRSRRSRRGRSPRSRTTGSRPRPASS